MNAEIAQKSIEAMNYLTATYTIVAQNARFCHRNVVGAHFEDDHEVFGELYDELSEELDDFAERVRALKDFPIGRLEDMLKLTELKEYSLPMNARQMQKHLLSDYEHISVKMEEFIRNVEEDHVTQDMIIGAKQKIEKRAWMLRSLLGE